jgi:long-subunit acyl-CoA synthetase (AMP-forming)
MLGYYKEEEATKNAFTEDGWLRTGDQGEIDSKGRVKILGRLSEKFKNQSGEFISPAPIEKLFAINPIIEQLCMVGKHLSSNIIIVTLNEAVDMSDRIEINGMLQEILHQVNTKLIKYEKIGHIIVVKGQWTIANNMLTPTNKIKRSVIEKQYENLIKFAALQPNVIVWELQ